MKDLDMSDVLADAEDQKADYYNKLWIALECNSDEELGKVIYDYGIEAREGRHFSMDVLRMAETIRLTRIATTLCEGCLDRTGCDMCCPPDFDDYYGINREAEENMLGRPLFPNEY